MMKVVFYLWYEVEGSNTEPTKFPFLRSLEMLLYRAGELYYLARFNQYFKKLGYWITSEEEKETIKSL